MSQVYPGRKYTCPCRVEGSAEHPADGVVKRITYLFETDGEGIVLTFTQEDVADQADDESLRAWLAGNVG